MEPTIKRGRPRGEEKTQLTIRIPIAVEAALAAWIRMRRRRAPLSMSQAAAEILERMLSRE